MIKLKELIELQSMVYTETIKPKHKKRFTRPTPHFYEDITIPKYQPPSNDSSTTLDEVKYLSSIKPNKDVVMKFEEVEDVVKPYAEELGIGKYVDDVIHESVKFIMTLKYEYNRPRPYQIAEFYGIDLNGLELDTMKTPSYPSGHATQGYLLGKYYSDKYPEDKEHFTQVGEDIAHSRVIAKAHYPSDKRFGETVAEYLYTIIKK